MAYWNGALWALGNGLANTLLVVYLVLELNPLAAGLGVSLVLAAPHLVGALRMTAPAMIDRVANRKRFCAGSFFLSACVLAALPWLAAPGRLSSALASLWAIVLLWCVYHLFQYLATVALWSWLADLVPIRVRGRFLGRRERWMVAGQAATMLAAGLFTWGWHELHPHWPRWIAYAVAAEVGVVFLLAAVVPLALMPRLAPGPRLDVGHMLRGLIAPLGDRRFVGLLVFGCWFSFSNGITQSAPLSYPAQVLGVSLMVMLSLRTGMRLGQFAASPALGRRADLAGNRPVLAVSLFLVAQGPLFYFLATPAQWWWIAGAWAVWIAYAGLNIALPNLMLRLSPEKTNTPHIAAYSTLTDLCYAASTIAGGLLADRFAHATFALGAGVRLDYYEALFLAGWILRTLGLVVLLVAVQEPRPTRPRGPARPGTG